MLFKAAAAGSAFPIFFYGFHRTRSLFVPVGKDQEPDLDLGRAWGRKLDGWLNWPELSEHRRVVLLAEASSGKSAEFRSQTDKFTAVGQAAFFVRIEELIDRGFEAALDADSTSRFEQWRKGTDESWFFLDSIDEARLNRKSFETALKRFARELGPRQNAHGSSSPVA